MGRRSLMPGIGWHADSTIGTPSGYAIKLETGWPMAFTPACYNTPLRRRDGPERLHRAASNRAEARTGGGGSSANIIAALCVRLRWNPKVAIGSSPVRRRQRHLAPGDLVTSRFALGLVAADRREVQNN